MRGQSPSVQQDIASENCFGMRGLSPVVHGVVDIRCVQNMKLIVLELRWIFSAQAMFVLVFHHEHDLGPFHIFGGYHFACVWADSTRRRIDPKSASMDVFGCWAPPLVHGTNEEQLEGFTVCYLSFAFVGMDGGLNLACFARRGYGWMFFLFTRQPCLATVSSNAASGITIVLSTAK